MNTEPVRIVCKSSLFAEGPQGQKGPTGPIGATLTPEQQAEILAMLPPVCRLRNRAPKPMHPALVGLLWVGVAFGLLGLAAVIFAPIYA